MAGGWVSAGETVLIDSEEPPSRRSKLGGPASGPLFSSLYPFLPFLSRYNVRFTFGRTLERAHFLTQDALNFSAPTRYRERLSSIPGHRRHRRRGVVPAPVWALRKEKCNVLNVAIYRERYIRRLIKNQREAERRKIHRRLSCRRSKTSTKTLSPFSTGCPVFQRSIREFFEAYRETGAKGRGIIERDPSILPAIFRAGPTNPPPTTSLSLPSPPHSQPPRSPALCHAAETNHPQVFSPGVKAAEKGLRREHRRRGFLPKAPPANGTTAVQCPACPGVQRPTHAAVRTFMNAPILAYCLVKPLHGTDSFLLLRRNKRRETGSPREQELGVRFRESFAIKRNRWRNDCTWNVDYYPGVEKIVHSRDGWAARGQFSGKKILILISCKWPPLPLAGYGNSTAPVAEPRRGVARRHDAVRVYFMLYSTTESGHSLPPYLSILPIFLPASLFQKHLQWRQTLTSQAGKMLTFREKPHAS
ncbi:hypothetical protein EAG_15135 [Camponotus floridanus]|uniref:Uncharacterized protein n=1 Tax=Camponotus floridanus TaxID=104421 RepID=E1ZYN6_CAMFO|nr:hypothetical protein EAG_15135 [Camponotus floridanus]